MLKLRSYYILISTIFSILAVIHFVRAYRGWEMSIMKTPVPVWASWIAAIVAAYLAGRGFQLADQCDA